VRTALLYAHREFVIRPHKASPVGGSRATHAIVRM